MKICTVKFGKLRKVKKYSLVVSVLIKKNSKLLLVKRKEGKSYAGFWGLPTGKVRVDEKLEEAAKRETKEETGLTIDIIEPYHITQEFHDDHHHVVIAFKSKIKSGKLKPGSDVEDVRWFSKSELSNLEIQPTAREQIKSCF